MIIHSPLSPIQSHLYNLVFLLIHSFPLFPWTSLVCVEFSDFPRSFSTSKSQISSTTNNTNDSHKQKIQVNAKLDRWFHHSFLFAPFHSHSRIDFTILSQVTFKQQLWFCTNYVVTHSFYLSDHFLGYHFSRWGGDDGSSIAESLFKHCTGSEEPLAYRKIT